MRSSAQIRKWRFLLKNKEKKYTAFFSCFFLVLFLSILLFSKKLQFVISILFLVEISIFGFVRCFASPNSEKGGGLMSFVCFYLSGLMSFVCLSAH